MDFSCLCRERINLAEFSLAEKVDAADRLFNTSILVDIRS